MVLFPRSRGQRVRDHAAARALRRIGLAAMDIRRAQTVPEFMAAGGAFLERYEAEHNLIFGICSQIEADPTQYEIPPRFLAVLDGDRVVGAELQTPPWRV